jgi:serine/threonine-protein kinase
MASSPANTSDQVVEELRETLAPELQLLERLGGGGMGDVFLARDPVLKRNVAVKVLAQHLGLSPQARERFAREAEAVAAVAHPNVVPIYRVGTLPKSELGYIVMAHVDGPTLREMLPPGTVGSESDVRRIVAEIAGALAAAHSRGVVHRDIKPANVLYDQLGGRFVVVDFGIASVLDRDSGRRSARLTLEGLPIGTPEYMSPEQAAGDPISEKSDIYSLGCLGYELLTGKPPITGATPTAVVFGHLHQQPVPVGTLRSDLSPEFAALVMRCLAKDPATRPDAEEITRALGQVRRATIEWPPPGLEALHRLGSQWLRATGRFAIALFLFVLVLGIHPAAARPCCADSPDRSPGWLLLKRLSMVTPIHFDDPDSLSIWYFLLDASFFVALAGLIPFGLGSVKLVNRLVAGRRSGYPLRVLARVAWDRHRDTRDLMNLTGRYALLPPARQVRQLERRGLGSAAIGLAATVLIATCLAWLAGILELGRDPGAGVLPAAELVLIAAPAIILVIGFLSLEVFDWRQRRPPRRSRARLQPLRQDVRDAWLTAAAVPEPAERWSAAAVRGLGAVSVLAGILAVIAAAYGLFAVFGASARFAGDRGRATEWVRHYQDRATPDSAVPRLEPRVALSLTAPMPLEATVAQTLLANRLPPADRRLLLEAIGPAFCLNPREVLFGIVPTRLDERSRLAGLMGVDTASLATKIGPDLSRDRGLAGLRHRARYCHRYFGDQARISTPARPRG